MRTRKEAKEEVYLPIQAVQLPEEPVHDPRRGEAVEKGAG